MPTLRTHYELLEVSPGATTDEIKRAYRRLVKSVHPDASTADDATQRFQALQKAYELLLDPQQRRLYDAQLNEERERQQRRAAIKLELTRSHPHLQRINDPQLLYVLAEIKAAPLHKFSRPTLNLCLALDRSLSMDGARLQQAKEAAFFVIDQLDSGDTLSVIAFSDRARAVVQGQSGADRTVAKTDVRNIQPMGGTELLQGVNAGLEELRKWHTATTLDHLILLTDGQTYGDEAGCLAAANGAAREKISLTLLGLGADWNDKLLDEMAARSGGYATFIDAPTKLVAIFQERFQGLTNAIAHDLQLTCHLNESAQLKDVYRVTPDIARIQCANQVMPLGVLEADQPMRLLLEVLVSAGLPGPQRVLRLDVDAELLSDGHKREHVDAEVMVEFSDSLKIGNKVPPIIEDLLARIAIFKVQEKAMAEAERGEHARATTRLQNLATHLLNFGEIELARAALLEAGELTRTGHLSDEGRKRIHYGTRNLSQTTIGKDKP